MRGLGELRVVWEAGLAHLSFKRTHVCSGSVRIVSGTIFCPRRSRALNYVVSLMDDFQTLCSPSLWLQTKAVLDAENQQYSY